MKPASPGRRRTLPYAALGAGLVVAFALAFAATSIHFGGKSSVLALARPVSAGQVLTDADLRSVQVTAGPGVAVIPVSAASSVVGRAAAVPLTVGSLLTRNELGAAQVPGAGQAVIAVSVKPGQFPVQLTAGAKVAVATAAASGSSATGAGLPLPADPSATVLSITPDGLSDGSSTVSLLTSAASASQVGAIPAGLVQLVILGAGS